MVVVGAGRRLLLVIGMFAWVIVGCGSSREANAPPTEPGSALRDGFTVAANTALVGTVFDDPAVFGSDLHGWVAILKIARDPAGVYDSYVRQARRLGVPLPGSGATANLCGSVDSGTTTATTSEDCPGFGPQCGVIEGMFTCSAVAAGGPSHPLDVQIELRWGGDTRHVVLTVLHSDFTREGPSFGTERLSGELPAIAVKPATQVRRVGAPFGGTNDAFERGYRRFRLERGSTVIGDAPALEVAVLHLDDNADAVLARYAAQLARPAKPPAIESVRLPDKGTILTLEYSPEAGGGARVKSDRTHRYALITYSSD